MAEEHQNDESKKTLVAFVVGLLIGGMLVWAFSGPEKNDRKDDKKMDEVSATSTEKVGEDNKAMTLAVGDANIKIADQAAASSVKIDSATYPVEEGWIAVRDYQDDKEGYVLGAVRFSKADGLVPTEISLTRPTIPGKKYAISLYKEGGDNDWGGDEKLEGIFGTFTAQ